MAHPLSQSNCFETTKVIYIWCDKNIAFSYPFAVENWKLSSKIGVWQRPVRVGVAYLFCGSYSTSTASTAISPRLHYNRLLRALADTQKLLFYEEAFIVISTGIFMPEFVFCPMYRVSKPIFRRSAGYRSPAGLGLVYKGIHSY